MSGLLYGFYEPTKFIKASRSADLADLGVSGQVTHIAAADDRGKIVGEPVAAPGVLLAPGEGTADAHTDAMYVTTTEVDAAVLGRGIRD